MHLRVACSPDADDVFMMRALTEGLIDTGPYTFEVTTEPTDALNRRGELDDVDVLAISVAWYPFLADRWQLLPHGGSLGEGYGPVVVAPQPMTLDDLQGKTVAVPGTSTTAWAILRMMADVEPVVIPIVPYARIFEALRAGEVDAGLIIHEGRLTFEAEGMHEVAELGRWWADATDGLPLPLGGNCIRRDMDEDVKEDVSELLRASIAHGLDHLDEAIDWLMERGTALPDREAVAKYLGMYANARTLDYGEEGRIGVEVLLEQGAALGFWPEVEVDWAP